MVELGGKVNTKVEQRKSEKVEFIDSIIDWKGEKALMIM